jgi:hypothetical protein
MSIKAEQRERRVGFIYTLGKWIRAFKDNIIAEEGAITQYKSQLVEFIENLGLSTLINPKNLIQPLSPKNEPAVAKATIASLAVNLGISEDAAQEIVYLLRNVLIGPPFELRGNPARDGSLRQIASEEAEHKEHFEKMNEIIEKFIKFLSESM